MEWSTELGRDMAGRGSYLPARTTGHGYGTCMLEGLLMNVVIQRLAMAISTWCENFDQLRYCTSCRNLLATSYLATLLTTFWWASTEGNFLGEISLMNICIL